MKIKHTFLSILTGLILAVGLYSCNTESSKNEKNSKLKVICTSSMIGDMVENLVSPDFEVTTLMGPGVDPHLYKPTSNDIMALKNSDVIVLNGLHLEGAMIEAVEKLDDTKTVIILGDALDKSDLRATAEFDGNYDPHIWFDANVWKKCALDVANKLAAVSTKGAEQVKKNGASYANELQALDQTIKEKLEMIPDSSRFLVTAHDAFGYLSKRYGIQVRALQGISTSSEFGLKDVNELAEFLTDHNVKSVFVESSISSKSLEKVIETCKDKGHLVSIGGELYTDALGEKGTAEATYIGMMNHNLETIVSNLK